LRLRDQIKNELVCTWKQKMTSEGVIDICKAVRFRTLELLTVRFGYHEANCYIFGYYLQHPYPSEDQKKQLAQDTGLTILQVNNW